MVKAKQNELTYLHFTVFGSDGITPSGNQAGNCSYYLAYTGDTAPESVSIGESDTTGHYDASFTPLSLGDYDLEVTCPDDRVIGENYEVEINDLDDLSGTILNLEGVMSGYTVETIIEINANETKLDTIQADLDDPDQYKAVITGLALEDSLSGYTVEIVSEINDNETEINNISGYIVDTETNISGVISDSESIVSGYVADVQADLDNPTQYMAVITGLALESSLSGYTAEIVGEVNENEAEIDNISGYIVDTETSISGYIADVDFDNISGLIIESDANVSGYIVDTESTISGYISDLDGNVSGFAAEIVVEIDQNEALLTGLTGDMSKAMGPAPSNNSYMEFGWVADEHQYLLHEVYDSPFNTRVHDGTSGLVDRYFGTGTYDGTGFPITFIKVEE